MELFKIYAAKYGEGNMDGTADFSTMLLYKLNGKKGMIMIGTSVYTHQQLRSSLHKGTLTLNRFERRFKNGTLEIKNSYGELRRKKQEAIAAQSNGIQIFEGDVSIPN